MFHTAGTQVELNYNFINIVFKMTSCSVQFTQSFREASIFKTFRGSSHQDLCWLDLLKPSFFSAKVSLSHFTFGYFFSPQHRSLNKLIFSVAFAPFIHMQTLFISENNKSKSVQKWRFYCTIFYWCFCIYLCLFWCCIKVLLCAEMDNKWKW